MMIEEVRHLDRGYVASSVRLADGVVAALGWALARAQGHWDRVNLSMGTVRVVPGPVVICTPDLKSLAEAEEIRQATAIVVVGARPGLKAWISAFRPERLAGAAIPVPDRVVDDPDVWAAMETFTDLINSGTGLTHPCDRSLVTDGLLELRRAGHTFDPDELMAAAFKLNWRGTAAWDLRVLASELDHAATAPTS
ncbi:hypothetical protein EV644_104575 [Kribbella orskensis]|uniref:ANTAR domain-containing protein n=2 Tax=Kribbellaceae TaxID=2726069 RepID=A0ABY2BPP7_9ACTN|nr:hypothetical protein EV642_103575 [Kribbella sp. VKM Ac-2500]TCO26071.1 hypothetical protein EV644_104575 [Kribbella orskensis]